jgi:hypothetical protein
MSKKARIAMAAVALVASAAAAAPATAATVTVTGDDGNPVTLAPGVPATTRNMDVDFGVALAGTEKGYAISVNGPVAPASTPRTCSTGSSIPLSADFQGNGTYTATVTTYTDTVCKVGAKAATYSVVINASTALQPPTGAVLTRAPDDYSLREYKIPIALNPGALSHEIHMAKGGVIAPDGSISGASKELFADSAGMVSARFDAPGTYVIVARAKGFTGAAGQFYSPWSAPITARVLAPFDFSGSVSFPDSRGPVYKLRATLRERGAKGKVKILMARGHKGGKFRSIGKAKIRGRVIKKTFTQHQIGKYRIRYVYKGSKLIAPGTVTQQIRITRRFF